MSLYKYFTGTLLNLSVVAGRAVASNFAFAVRVPTDLGLAGVEQPDVNLLAMLDRMVAAQRSADLTAWPSASRCSGRHRRRPTAGLLRCCPNARGWRGLGPEHRVHRGRTLRGSLRPETEQSLLLNVYDAADAATAAEASNDHPQQHDIVLDRQEPSMSSISLCRRMVVSLGASVRLGATSAHRGDAWHHLLGRVATAPERERRNMSHVLVVRRRLDHAVPFSERKTGLGQDDVALRSRGGCARRA
jgi:hypothetical protein